MYTVKKPDLILYNLTKLILFLVVIKLSTFNECANASFRSAKRHTIWEVIACLYMSSSVCRSHSIPLSNEAHVPTVFGPGDAPVELCIRGHYYSFCLEKRYALYNNFYFNILFIFIKPKFALSMDVSAAWRLTWFFLVRRNLLKTVRYIIYFTGE